MNWKKPSVAQTDSAAQGGNCMSKGKRNREKRKEENDLLMLMAKRNNLQKLVNEECRKKLLELDEEFSADYEAAILWQLHEMFGFGQSRLIRFYKAFATMHEQLRKHYEISQDEQGWLYRQKLLGIGVDVDELRKEQ